jgi:hypothetical protein
MNMGDGRVWRVVLPVGEVSDERNARSEGREGVGEKGEGRAWACEAISQSASG